MSRPYKKGDLVEFQSYAGTWYLAWYDFPRSSDSDFHWISPLGNRVGGFQDVHARRLRHASPLQKLSFVKANKKAKPNGQTSDWKDSGQASIYHDAANAMGYYAETRSKQGEGPWQMYTLDNACLFRDSEAECFTPLGEQPTREEAKAHLDALRQQSAKHNPTRRWDFTPSYPASSKEEYQQRVKEGNKRNLHIVVEGGRTAARYDEPPREETMATRSERLYRWVEQEPPWDARTQAPAVREVTLPALRPASRVERAIETLRAQQPMGALGFLVPSTIVPLVQAGFTKKEAEILLDRAQGRFFLALDDPTALSQFPLSDLLSLFVRAITERLVITQGHEIMLVPPGKRRGSILRGFALVEGKGRKPIPIITSRQLKEMYRLNKEAVTTTLGRPYGDDGRDDANYIKAVLAVVRRFILPRLNGKKLRVALLIDSPEGKEVRYLPVGEHFVSRQKGAEGPKIQYRTLKNVSLAALPDLLVSLSRRKKRRGRRLSRITP